MTEPRVIDRLYDDFSELQKFLDKKGKIGLRSVVDNNFPKTMLLAAASDFEDRLTTAVRKFTKGATAENHVLVSLVENQVISRKYHSWFQWGDKKKPERNANQFFGMFGDGFKKHAIEQVKRDENLTQAVADFIEIGWERNRLVHQNFADYRLEKTASEIHYLYKSAEDFVDWFPREIRDYSEVSATAALSP